MSRNGRKRITWKERWIPGALTRYVLFPVYFNSRLVKGLVVRHIGELKRRRGQRERKKAVGLDWQNNNFARASRFFVLFSPSLHDYDVKIPNFTFCRGREHRTTYIL